MKINREDNDYIVSFGNVVVTFEGLGALLTVLGFAALMVFFFLLAIF